MDFSIIHLTDMHIMESGNTLLKKADAIFAACRSIISQSDKVVIVISGDIAYSGKVEEYDLASSFINKIRDAVSNYTSDSVEVLCVPGNHDCDFSNVGKVRSRLLSTVRYDEDIDSDTIDEICAVQKNFEKFASQYIDIDCKNLCMKKIVDFNKKKVAFNLVNTAWMSEMYETPGRIVIPRNQMPLPSEENCDLSITISHHPYNWLHPDNCAEYISSIRSSTDILIMGHEHRRDLSDSSGESWNIKEIRGKELQNGSDEKSEFAVYQFDNGFQNLTTYTFSWQDDKYREIDKKFEPFSRNTILCSSFGMPSNEFIKDYIEDPGMIINHFREEDIKLSELFCWPEIEMTDIQNDSNLNSSLKMGDQWTDTILNSNITILYGPSLVGKTSIAKMLYKKYLDKPQCCVLLEGSRLNTIVEKNLWEIIAQHYTEQYSADYKDDYKQLASEERILIVDSLDSIPYTDERRSKVITYLSRYAKNVIILSTDQISAHLVCTKADIDSAYDINYYQIRHFGNRKRYELIRKWYYLRTGALCDGVLDERIERARETIDSMIGRYGSIVPSSPLFLISILQNFEAAAPASFSGSQYGYLYESLINKSLSTINNTDQSKTNIYINILSLAAFSLLKKKTDIFSKHEFEAIVGKVSKDKLLAIEPSNVLDDIISSRLIKDIGEDTYSFKYPYIFYFFAGRYIAYNLSAHEVTEQLQYMIERLYNEKFGNIVIFICHFANSLKIIEDLLLQSYSIYETTSEFDFDKHSELFEKANEAIERVLDRKSIEDNSSVDANKNEYLQRRDEAGIQDGTETMVSDITDEEAQKEEALSHLNAAMRTMDVLGQIIVNYPGDIDGHEKKLIIDEVHKLGMRITETLLTTLGSEEEDFVDIMVDDIKKRNPDINKTELTTEVRTMFSLLMASFAYSMIKKTASSLNNESILRAINETFEESDSLSQVLIVQELKTNLLRKPDVSELIDLSRMWKKDNNKRFAHSILKMIVWYYLKYNKCKSEIRNRLCSEFAFSSTDMLIESAKNDSDS